MATGFRSIEISERAFNLIRRAAALDRVDVATCLESMVMCHSEEIRTREYMEGVARIGRDEDGIQAVSADQGP